MCDQSGRSPNSAPARFVVRNRHRPQRLAYQRRCGELFACWKNRTGAPREAESFWSNAVTECWSATNDYSITPTLPSLQCFSLRHKHGETFAGAAGFDEFAHWQRVTAVAALSQLRHELGRAFGQDDVAVDHHGVTR